MSKLLFDPDTGTLIVQDGKFLLDDAADCCCGDDSPPTTCFGLTFGIGEVSMFSDFDDENGVWTGSCTRNALKYPTCYRLFIDFDITNNEKYLQCATNGTECNNGGSEQLLQTRFRGSIEFHVAGARTFGGFPQEGWALLDNDEADLTYQETCNQAPHEYQARLGSLQLRATESNWYGTTTGNPRWCNHDTLYESVEPLLDVFLFDVNKFIDPYLRANPSAESIRLQELVDRLYLFYADSISPNCDGAPIRTITHEYDSFVDVAADAASRGEVTNCSWDYFTGSSSNNRSFYSGSAEYLGRQGACGLLIDTEMRHRRRLATYKSDGFRFGQSDTIRDDARLVNIALRIRVKPGPFTDCLSETCDNSWTAPDGRVLTDIACVRDCRTLGSLDTFPFGFGEKDVIGFDRRSGFGNFRGRDDNSSGDKELDGAGSFL